MLNDKEIYKLFAKHTFYEKIAYIWLRNSNFADFFFINFHFEFSHSSHQIYLSKIYF